MSKAEEAAAAAAATILAEAGGEAPDVEEAPVEAEAEAQVEAEEDSLPDLELHFPDDLLVELGMPDFEEDPEVEEFEDYEGDSEVVKRMRQAEKRAEYLEGLRVKDQRKTWAAEAAKFAPLSKHALDTIEATSRHDFMRQAKAAHELVQKHLQPYVALFETEKQAEIEKARVEAKEEAAKAWGRPHGSGTTVPADVEDHRNQVEKARRHGDLSDVIKAMAFPKRS